MLPDYLATGLDIVFVGLNPGEYSDRVGHYFARQQNMFWGALYASGLLPEPLTPNDDSRMPQLGYGLTDIVKRATANASHVADVEFAEGAKVLRAKLEPLSPRVVCFVGLVGYRAGIDRHALPGEQVLRWSESRLFVTPSTSPRNARYRPEIVDWFVRLREFLTEVKRGEIKETAETQR